ncbi:hypothetical protein M404DRAFT_1003234 [Pisolithus tinctorius Marx 270]|uniref:Uncharacterized protein n=1 Tax=Pisolithus tinctorius Marx 270 TaxID=870435 RepID=A0A0C3P1H0_PISTI|nr:hypothetical protein M404DRAFT_1003234 [Pisolithus tinctorius Marx 270]
MPSHRLAGSQKVADPTSTPGNLNQMSSPFSIQYTSRPLCPPIFNHRHQRTMHVLPPPLLRHD